MEVTKTKLEDSYTRRRDFLLTRIRQENWEAPEEKPRKKFVTYVNKKSKKQPRLLGIS
jgi:hypothetical protein